MDVLSEPSEGEHPMPESEGKKDTLALVLSALALLVSIVVAIPVGIQLQNEWFSHDASIVEPADNQIYEAAIEPGSKHFYSQQFANFGARGRYNHVDANKEDLYIFTRSSNEGRWYPVQRLRLNDA